LTVGRSGQALRAIVVASAFLAGTPVWAQDLFEIQVYPYETVEPHRTMVELHTNYFAKGTKSALGDEFPLNHQAHLTLEVTHGITKYFELAGYLVTAAHVPNEGGKFAGARIRPRVRFPESSNFPFNVSLSFELGFNQARFEANTRTLEIRPILERQQGRLYLSINPDLSKALKGPDSHAGLEFEPGVKLSWDVTRKVAAGVEYYGATGSLTDAEPAADQRHMIFPTLDLNVSPDWELNFGVGRGLTHASEKWVIKSIVGYRFKH
jgi:hypothetical protein